ncbi:hypothetical protein KXQ82_01955 [Mucilaginibacter sp. HMF5004]|uniref:hypothetical protein n=1 Tax=Mucilaginibacter rivuli TaxID=2857527 RepID=UPI001C5E109D|nr:hypothetical protein [Mucilaginibacter rivuli]MBW4888454.1 hypothetical protein [Mucilaginibacter rivuli]
MEKQMDEKQQAVFNEIREVRKSDYVRAISRIKAFERQAEPSLTTFNGTVKSTVSFNPFQVIEEEISPQEKEALDSALETIRLFEKRQPFPYDEEFNDIYADLDTEAEIRNEDWDNDFEL